MLRTPQEEEEDAYIAYMERKLGWVKGGKRTAKYGAGDEDDGLGGTSLRSYVCHYTVLISRPGRFARGLGQLRGIDAVFRSK